MPSEFFTDTIDDSGTVHGQLSLAVDTPQTPKIVYTTTSGAVMLAERVGDEWVRSALPAEPAAHDEYRVSLVLDSASRPHVAYVSAASDLLIYGVLRTSWQFEEVPTEGGLFPGRVRFPSLKLYSGLSETDDRFRDAPHVAYQAGLSLQHLTKRRRHDRPGDPPVWKKNAETVDESGLLEKGWFATLDIDGADTARIAYFDDASPAGRTSRRLHLATRQVGVQSLGQPRDWQVETLDNGDDLLGEAPSLIHSFPGEGAVSYFDRNRRALNLCLFGNFPESPVIEVVSADLDGDGVRSSVAVSRPSPDVIAPPRFCVAFGAGGRLRFSTRTGAGAFEIEDVDAGGEWPSLAFDDEGNAHLAHVANGVLRYAISPRSGE